MTECIETDKKLKSKHKNIIIAFLFNAIVLASYIFVLGVSYESNDDYSLSIIIDNSGYCNFTFINFFLCKFVCLIQTLMPFANWFVLMQIIFSYIAFCILTHLILKTSDHRLIHILFFICVTVFSFDHYSRIQFTKTSALLITTGSLFIIYLWINNNKKFIPYLMGAILMILGAMYRYQNLILIIGFAGLFIMGYVIINIKNHEKRNWKKRIILLTLIFLLIFLGAYGIEIISDKINNSTEELKEYMKNDAARSSVSDYQMNYADCAELCGKLGISETAYNLMQWNWYYDYDGAASANNLIALAEYRNKTNRVFDANVIIKYFYKYITENIKQFTRSGVHILILILISAIGMAVLRAKWMVFPFLIGAFSVFCYLYLIFIGRFPYRATYGIDLAATVFLIFSMSFVLTRCRIHKKKRRFEFLLAIVIIITSLFINLYFCSLYVDVNKNYPYYSDELFEYMDKNKNSLFVFDTRTSGSFIMHLSYYNKPLAKLPDGFCMNMSSFGGWGKESPYDKMILSRFGVDNVFEDIIDKNNVYVVDMNNKLLMEDYLNEYYGEKDFTIYYNSITNINGFDIWNVKKK